MMICARVHSQTLAEMYFYNDVQLKMVPGHCAPTFDVLGRAVQRELGLLRSPVHREVNDFCCHVIDSEPLMSPCSPLL